MTDEEFKTLMGNFRALFPEHNDKKLFGIIATVDMSEMLNESVGGGVLCGADSG
jgi:hypothetical protein